MDTVVPVSRREALSKRVETAKTALLETANTAVIKNDPLSQHLNALALSVDAHFDIYCATEEAQAYVAENIQRHSDLFTEGALDAVRASLLALEKELGPQLLKATLPTMREALHFIKARTILVMLLSSIAFVAIVGVFTYAAGLNSGRSQGELAAQTIQGAMDARPEVALDWALLMANNDPVLSLKECRKAISTDSNGRWYCDMPVWLSPASNPPQ